MLRFDAPGLDLGQGGEGGRVLGLDELKQLQALDRARGDGKALRGGGLLQLQHLAAAVVKFHGGPGPPGVMREVGAQGQAQLVDGDRAAKVQRECGVGVAVDAPALVGPDAVGVVLVNAVDGVAGRKDSLAAGLNVGMGMGEEAGVAVLVIGVVGQVAARGDLLRGGKAGADDVAGTGKALGAVGDGLLAVPWQAYMVPQFMMMRSWHLNNTHLAIICLQAFSAFGVFMMKQFYEGVPTELCEAARIDGLSEYGIYARIMLPLSLPAVSTLVIFTFVNTWNDFLGPLIYLTKTELKTIQIGLRMFISQYSAEYGLIMAASVVALIPVLIVFLSLQKYFVQGVASSGLKG